MNYRNGSEPKVGDQVLARTPSGAYVAGVVAELRGERLNICPAICGAVMVEADLAVPIQASAFAEQPAEPVAVVELPLQQPPISNEAVAPGTEQFSTQPAANPA